MFLFKHLELAGLDRIKLQSFSDEDIIPLEKKLLAENRLNNSISKNDIESVVTILKTYPEEVKILAKSEYFYTLLSGIDPERSSKLLVKTHGQVEKIKTFLFENFGEDLQNYLSRHIARSHWTNLITFLKYRKFLDQRILQPSIYKLEEKIELTLDELHNFPEEEELGAKMSFLKDPQFFSLLSSIDFKHFDGPVLNLLNFIKENTAYASKDFFFFMRTAIKGYKPSDSRFSQHKPAPTYSTSNDDEGGTNYGRIIFLIIAVIKILLLLLK